MLRSLVRRLIPTSRLALSLAFSLPLSLLQPATASTCAQVITQAKHPASGEIRQFSTPCDVPYGWIILTPGMRSSDSAAVLEDAEHSSRGNWRLRGSADDNSIANRWDKQAGSQVIRIRATQTGAAAVLPVQKVVGQGRKFVTWRQRFNGDYALQFRVIDSAGETFRLRYQPLSEKGCVNLPNSNIVRCGLDSSSTDNQWRQIRRNLQFDLRRVFPELEIAQIKTLLVQGDGAIDDLQIAASKRHFAQTKEMRRFTSARALTRYLREAAQNEQRYLRQLRNAPIALADSATATQSQSSVSSTNLQEAGVDEADRIKSDGRHLYLLGNHASGGQSLRVIELAAPPLNSTELTELQLTDTDATVTYQGLYLIDDLTGGDQTAPNTRLLTLASSASTGLYYFNPMVRMAKPITSSPPRTQLDIYDVSQPASPQRQTELSIDGSLVASRRIGRSLYLITRNYPLSDQTLRKNLTAKQSAASTPSLRQLATQALPKWHLDGSPQGSLLNYSDCYYADGEPIDASAHTLLTITRIDLDAPSEPPRSSCIVGQQQTLYVSPESLYLAGSQNDSIDRFDGLYNTPFTRIHKFALQDQGPEYRGMIDIEGNLGWEQDKASFRLSEYQGVLRVTTSRGNTWDNTSTTHLTTVAEVDGELQILASLPNADRPAPLGKLGERLYSVRYVAEKAYLVTFKVTDPLYVVDLTDPSDPLIEGELEIPGYSDYLHPLQGDRLLGIGKHALAAPRGDDERAAWYQGIKLALFDVSDPSAPIELNSVVIGERGSHSPLLNDHHALAFVAGQDGMPDRLALPIEVHNGLPNQVSDAKPWTWYDWSNTGLHLFELDSSGVHAVGQLTVAESSQKDTSDPRFDPFTSWSNYYYFTDRALIAGDTVHYIYGNELWSADWFSPEDRFGPN